MKRSVFLLLVFWFSYSLCSFGQDYFESAPANALLPPKIVAPPTEEYGAEKRTFQGIPSVAVASDGALWRTWYGGTGENVWSYVLVARSVDGGETWSEPLFVVDWPGEVRVYDPNIWSDPNGVLHLFWAQSEDTNNDGRLGVWTISTREPEKGAAAKWSAPRRLCNGIMLEKPTVDSNGRWLYPVSHKPNGAKYKMDPKQLGAAVYLSYDEGETLQFVGAAEIPVEERGCDEHSVVELMDGRLRIYSRFAHGIGVADSDDGGFTWTKAALLENVKHTSSRVFVRKLASGALLMVKNGPLDQDVGRAQMTAFLSNDDGKTWLGGLVLDERDSVSYPDGDQAPDGTIYVTYDRDRTGDKEICLAKFTEKEVLQGKFN